MSPAGTITLTLKSLVLAVGLIGLLGCRPTASPPPPTPAPLVASKFTGTPEIQLPPNPWTPLLTNQPVQPGSQLRTGTNSFLELTSTSNWQRVLLPSHSEVAIERWTQSSSPGTPRDEAQIKLRQGLLLIDLPAASMRTASSFDVSGSNFIVSARSGGIAAITADGFVLVQTGTIVCVLISPPAQPTAITLNSGQMLDPVARVAKPIPASSNQVWNLLFN